VPRWTGHRVARSGTVRRRTKPRRFGARTSTRISALTSTPGLEALVDEHLGAEDDGQREAVGVVGARFGGVDRDAQIVAGVDECIAVEGDVPYSRVVDDLRPSDRDDSVGGLGRCSHQRGPSPVPARLARMRRAQVPGRTYSSCWRVLIPSFEKTLCR
jgi:hypothetical protein